MKISANSPNALPAAVRNWLDRWFGLSVHGVSVRSEFIGGLTTFAAMAYIALVLPAFYVHAGMDQHSAVSAVILTTCLGTLLMGVVGRMPIAVAPGLGLAAYFAYTVCGSMGNDWQLGLTATVCAGAVFVLIAVSGLWRVIIDAVPAGLRMSIGAGIGLFIAFVGLKNGGVIVAHEATYVTLGYMPKVNVFLTLGGVALAAALMARRVPGGLFISLVVVTLASMAFGLSPYPRSISDIFAVTSLIPDRSALQLKWDGIFTVDMLHVVFAISLVGFFDGAGVLLSLGHRCKILNGTDADTPRLRGAIMASSLATISGGLLGTSVTAPYVESSAGVAAGARTGLSAVFTAMLFGLAIFFLPLLKLIPPETGSVALIIIGSFMLGDIRHIEFDDMTEAVPAFFTMLMMVLTFSIAEGIAFGFIFYSVIKLLAGRGREVKPTLYIISLIFLLHLVISKTPPQ